MIDKHQAVAALDEGALTQILRKDLLSLSDNIPSELKALKGWLLYKTPIIRNSDGSIRINKIPHYANKQNRSGVQGGRADLKRLATFDEVFQTFKSDESFAGMGFATLPAFGVVAYDGDKCVEIVDEQVRYKNPITQELIAGTYAEISPSETGVRALFLGQAPSVKNVAAGHELFGSNGFVTITGDIFSDCADIQPLSDERRELLIKYCTASAPAPVKTQVLPAPAEIVAPLEQDLRSALEYLDPEEYQSWTSLGLALKTAPLPDDQRWSIYRDFSARSDKFDENECRAKWASFKPTRTDFRKIFNDAKALGWRSPLTSVETLISAGASQDMVAELFAQKYLGEMLYAHDFGTWLEFDGTRWLREAKRRAFEYARQLTRKTSVGAKEATKASFFAGVETIAKSDPRLACSSAEFDFDNYQINTPDGVYDLATGEVRPHDPTQMLTKITSVAPTAQHSGVFLKTLLEICNGDNELAHFHKVSLGSILSGAVEEAWLLYWFGTGRNGKNLLADLVFSIMGDYAHKLPSSALMSKKYESHPSELTGLRGVRLALSSEIEEGAYWNEARLKELTGDENITARYMRQDAFTFTKSHKHLILGNHRPQIKTIDPAIKSRVRLVPFDVSFAGREDRDLPAKLRAEAGFVLRWLIDGHSEWLANGKKLPECAAVDTATQDYFAAQSTIEMWIAENCVEIKADDRLKKDWPRASALFFNYQEWKRSRGEMPVTQTRFGEAMRNKYEKAVNKGTAHYIGIDIAEASGRKFDIS